jgi:hypothetical protein
MVLQCLAYSQQKLTQAVQKSIIIPTNQELSFASCLKLSFRTVEYPFRQGRAKRVCNVCIAHGRPAEGAAAGHVK